jgi:hypothetical protein
MRRLNWIAVGLVAALGATSVALASESRARETTAVSATFTAAPSGTVASRTCTGADGTYQITRGLYTGTVTGSDVLAGSARIRAKSVYNTSEGLGVVSGALVVRDAAGHGKFRGYFTAVNKGGTLSGTLAGLAREPRRAVFGTFSADFGSSGFAAGKVGTGSVSGSAIALQGRSCQGS